MNICSAGDDFRQDLVGDEYFSPLSPKLREETRSGETDGQSSPSRGNYRSLHRRFVVQGVDDKDEIIISTPESLSTSRASSRSSQSPSLSRSPSCSSSSETSIESFRIHSSNSDSTLGNIPTSSSCCGVNLRSSPTPTSPPYESSPSHSKSGTRSGTPETFIARGLEGHRPTPSPSGSSKCPNFLETPTAEIEQSPGRKRGKSPKSTKRIDRSYLTRKNGVQNNNISMSTHKDLYKSGSNDSFAKVKAKVNNTFSPAKRFGKILKSHRKPDAQEHGKYFGGNENYLQDSLQSSSVSQNPGKNPKGLPTVERAKRLSKLIQQRQHTQLQFSLNIAMVRASFQLCFILLQIRSVFLSNYSYWIPATVGNQVL